MEVRRHKYNDGFQIEMRVSDACRITVTGSVFDSFFCHILFDLTTLLLAIDKFEY